MQSHENQEKISSASAQGDPGASQAPLSLRAKDKPFDRAVEALLAAGLEEHAKNVAKSEQASGPAGKAIRAAARLGAWDAASELAFALAGSQRTDALAFAARKLGGLKEDGAETRFAQWDVFFAERAQNLVRDELRGLKSPAAKLATQEREALRASALAGAWEAAEPQRALRMAQSGAGLFAAGSTNADSPVSPFNLIEKLARESRWADLADWATMAPARSVKTAASQSKDALALAAQAADGQPEALRAFEALIAAGASAAEALRHGMAMDLSINAARRLMAAGAHKGDGASVALRALARASVPKGAQADRQRALAAWLLTHGADPFHVSSGKDAMSALWLSGVPQKDDTPARAEIRKQANALAAKKRPARPSSRSDEREAHRIQARARQEAAIPRAQRPVEDIWRKSSGRWALAVELLLAEKDPKLTQAAKKLRQEPTGEIAATEAMLECAKQGRWEPFFALAERGAGRGSPRSLAHAAWLLGAASAPEADAARWSKIWNAWAQAETGATTTRRRETQEALDRALASAAKANDFKRVKQFLSFGAQLSCRRLVSHNPAHEKPPQAPLEWEKERNVVENLAQAGRWGDVRALCAALQNGAIRKGGQPTLALALAANAAETGDVEAQAAFRALRKAGVSNVATLKSHAATPLNAKGMALLIQCGGVSDQDKNAALRAIAQISESSGARAETLRFTARLLIEQGADPLAPAGANSMTAANMSKPSKGATPAREEILNWKSSRKAAKEAQALRAELGLSDPNAVEPLETLTLGRSPAAKEFAPSGSEAPEHAPAGADSPRQNLAEALPQTTASARAIRRI